jgi:hypothetical protein
MEIQDKFYNKMKLISSLMFLIISFSCQNKQIDKKEISQQNKFFYKKDNFNIDLIFKNKDKKEMIFNLSTNNFGIKNFGETASLVLIEDIGGKMIVPEGTNRIDYNNPKDIIGYKCDSTYTYYNDTLQIVIAIENYNNKRLDLQIEMSGKIKKSFSKTLLKDQSPQ